MNKLLGILSSGVVFSAAMGLLAPGSVCAQGASVLMFSDEEHSIHIFPPVGAAVERAAARTTLNAQAGQLDYHGGPVMSGNVTTYAIFWAPAKLQNGKPTTMSAHYRTVQLNMLSDYPGHGIDNNNTQYYQGSASQTYIRNAGGLGGSYVDTSPYPHSGCTDPATPGNCISDAQIHAEIKKVMALKGWTGGLNKMFLLFTSSGEG